MTSEGDATLHVLAVLEHLGIPYAIGGSYASSVHGVPRSTNDMDVTVALAPADCDRLASGLGEGYYMDPLVARDAVAREASFNIIHELTGHKVDVFPAGRDAFRNALLRRNVTHDIEGRPSQFVSAEDIVLLKLDWYEQGGRVSDTQWRDVLGVLAAQEGRLDEGYLNSQAARMGLSELLARAKEEASVD